jgi:DNA-binding NtrC family response regulator
MQSGRAPKKDRDDELARVRNEAERKFLVDRLRDFHGVIGKVADAIGVSRRTLQDRVGFHDLNDFAKALRSEARARGLVTPTDED